MSWSNVFQQDQSGFAGRSGLRVGVVSASFAVEETLLVVGGGSQSAYLDNVYAYTPGMCGCLCMRAQRLGRDTPCMIQGAPNFR